MEAMGRVVDLQAVACPLEVRDLAIQEVVLLVKMFGLELVVLEDQEVVQVAAALPLGLVELDAQVVLLEAVVLLSELVADGHPMADVLVDGTMDLAALLPHLRLGRTAMVADMRAMILDEEVEIEI